MSNLISGFIPLNKIPLNEKISNTVVLDRRTNQYKIPSFQMIERNIKQTYVSFETNEIGEKIFNPYFTSTHAPVLLPRLFVETVFPKLSNYMIYLLNNINDYSTYLSLDTVEAIREAQQIKNGSYVCLDLHLNIEGGVIEVLRKPIAEGKTLFTYFSDILEVFKGTNRNCYIMLDSSILKKIVKITKTLDEIVYSNLNDAPIKETDETKRWINQINQTYKDKETRKILSNKRNEGKTKQQLQNILDSYNPEHHFVLYDDKEKYFRDRFEKGIITKKEYDDEIKLMNKFFNSKQSNYRQKFKSSVGNTDFVNTTVTMKMLFRRKDNQIYSKYAPKLFWLYTDEDKQYLLTKEKSSSYRKSYNMDFTTKGVEKQTIDAYYSRLHMLLNIIIVLIDAKKKKETIERKVERTRKAQDNKDRKLRLEQQKLIIKEGGLTKPSTQKAPKGTSRKYRLKQIEREQIKEQGGGSVSQLGKSIKRLSI